LHHAVFPGELACVGREAILLVVVLLEIQQNGSTFKNREILVIGMVDKDRDTSSGVQGEKFGLLMTSEVATKRGQKSENLVFAFL